MVASYLHHLQKERDLVSSLIGVRCVCEGLILGQSVVHQTQTAREAGRQRRRSVEGQSYDWNE
jgi:hypothetical protein